MHCEKNRITRLTLVMVTLTIVACDDASGPSDGDADGDIDADVGDSDIVVEICTDNGECDDGLFCNGTELCDPDDDEANSIGCVSAGDPPCGEGLCSEVERSCTDPCPDADGDGHRDQSCGGDDCDDDDANAYPGNFEVCDAAGHDDDCNPSTLGHDRDGDSHVSNECCNFLATGELLCGTDCNDDRATVNPTAVESCNEIDDNCNGVVDEGVLSTYYRDNDGDGFGVSSETQESCAAPPGYAVLPGDCDDTLRPINPSALEICDGVDNNCDGETDEECPCSLGDTQVCGEPDGLGGFITEGQCRTGTQSCRVTGDWGACEGAVFPEDDLCNNLDDDCDGSADEDLECPQNADVVGINRCGREGIRSCNAACAWSDDDYFLTETHETCDYCADSGLGLLAELPFAEREESRSFWSSASYTDGPVTFGDASLVWVGGWENRYVSGTLYNSNSGAIFAYRPIQIGHGTTTFEMEVSASSETANPRFGWAVVFLQGSGGPAWDDVADDGLGVPEDRNGWSVEWRFYCPTCGGSSIESDQVAIRRLNARGADPELPLDGIGAPYRLWPDARLDSGYDTETQSLTITITPDDPTTSPNEMEITVSTTTTSGGALQSISCRGDACEGVIVPGEMIEWGLSGTRGRSTPSSVVVPGYPSPNSATSTELCPE